MSKPISQVYGELEVTFIGGDFMAQAWSDKGSGGTYNGAYYNPDFGKLGSDYSGYLSLGSFGQNSYGSPNGAMLLVKDVGGKQALKFADDFVQIWTDKDSGADKDGSFWLPVSKDASYKALGTVCVQGYDKPDPKKLQIAVVRQDLTAPATIGSFIWDDESTGADKDFGSWEIQIGSLYVDSTKFLLAPGCFVAVTSHHKPSSASNANVLLLPIAATANDTPFYPTLTSADQPPQYTSSDVYDLVVVPYSAVTDKGLSLAQKIAQSPFYQIRRDEVYELAYFNINNSSVAQAVTVSEKTGVSTTESQTFSVTTGISVTATTGVSFLGTGGTVSATVSTQLGYSSTVGITEFDEKTVTQQYSMPARTAFAVWTKFDQLTVYRLDGTAVASPLAFRENTWVQSEYALSAAQAEASLGKKMPGAIPSNFSSGAARKQAAKANAKPASPKG